MGEDISSRRVKALDLNTSSALPAVGVLHCLVDIPISVMGSIAFFGLVRISESVGLVKCTLSTEHIPIKRFLSTAFVLIPLFRPTETFYMTCPEKVK